MRDPRDRDYRDADGARHELVVRETADGRLAGARLDVARRRRTSSTRSTGDEDGRPQAEAIARDYLTTVGRSPTRGGTGGRRAHT